MAAESAEIVDALLRRYTLVGGIVGALVLGYLLWTAWWHRRHGPGDPRDAPRAGIPAAPRGKAWVISAMVVVIALILFPLAIGTQSSHEHLETPHQEPGLVLEVVGFRYGWTVRYPGGFEALNEVRIPSGTLVRLDVTSMDVMHKFHVPDYRTGVDAMPGKTNTLFLNVPDSGTASVVHCAELCGPGHALMKAHIVVMEPSGFQDWLAAQQAPATGAPAQVLHVGLNADGATADVGRLMAQVPIELRISNTGSSPQSLRVAGLWDNVTKLLQPGEQTNASLDPVISAGTLTLQAQDEVGAPVGGSFGIDIAQPIKSRASLKEFSIQLDAHRFPAGAAILLTVENSGAIPHDLHIGAESDGIATPVLSGDGTAYLPFWMPDAGTIDAWCALPGHADGGMHETLEAIP